MEVRTADRAARVPLGDLARLAHGDLPSLVVVAEHRITGVCGVERHRRAARALVNRDENSLGTTAQTCGGDDHLVPPAPAAAVATATATATAAEAATATAAAAAATTTARTLLRDVDAERATFEILAVELVERLLGALRGGHLDKAEPARLTGHPIQHERDLADLAAGGELLVDEVLSGVEREVTDVQTIRHVTLTLWRHSRFGQTPASRSEGEVWIALYENAPAV